MASRFSWPNKAAGPRLDLTRSIASASNELCLTSDLEHPDKGGWKDYCHIVPNREGLRLLYVERGEPSPVADAGSGALLVFLVFAGLRWTASDIAGRSWRAYRQATGR